MAGIDSALNKLVMFQASKTLMNEGNMPCPFGNDICIISSLGVKQGAGDDGITYRIVACRKARAVNCNYRVLKRQEQLFQMGCPNTKYSIFSKWSCKYADGQWYSI